MAALYLQFQGIFYIRIDRTFYHLFGNACDNVCGHVGILGHIGFTVHFSGAADIADKGTFRDLKEIRDLSRSFQRLKFVDNRSDLMSRLVLGKAAELLGAGKAFLVKGAS